VDPLFPVLALIAIAVFVVVLDVLTRKRPYACPPGRSIATTVQRHVDAGPMLMALDAAGIDTQTVEEPAKSLWRRLPAILYCVHEPPGPWHVVVPTERLDEAQRLLSPRLEGSRGNPA
jgi:hypothetical protein